MSNLKILSNLFLISLFFPSICSGQSLDRNYLSQLTKEFVLKETKKPKNGQIKITVGKIDPRIQIKPCQSELKLNIPQKRSSRNLNVKIYCSDSTPWHLFLPVRVELTVPVVVASRKLDKGTTLDNSNIEIKLVNQNKLRGQTINDLSTVIGAKTKRSLMLGKPLTPKNVCFVCKGDPVVIIAKSSEFAIKTNGIALSDGAIGERIRVKNSRSGRTINAQVKTINRVVINL